MAVQHVLPPSLNAVIPSGKKKQLGYPASLHIHHRRSDAVHHAVVQISSLIQRGRLPREGSVSEK